MYNSQSVCRTCSTVDAGPAGRADAVVGAVRVHARAVVLAWMDAHARVTLVNV